MQTVQNVLFTNERHSLSCNEDHPVFYSVSISSTKCYLYTSNSKYDFGNGQTLQRTSVFFNHCLITWMSNLNVIDVYIKTIDMSISGPCDCMICGL